MSLIQQQVKDMTHDIFDNFNCKLYESDAESIAITLTMLGYCKKNKVIHEVAKHILEILKTHMYYPADVESLPKQHRVIDEDDVINTITQFLEKEES